MKKLIVNIISRIEVIQYSNPRLFKIGMICLWCLCPLEMLCIKLGVFGYKKIKSYNKKTIELSK